MVVPVYNHASFLAECLNSIIKNSPPETEIILVNDGSTDHFSEVVEPYLKLAQVTLIEQENLGISAALNRGVKEASGTLLTWQSADNVVKNEGYSRLVRFIAANPSVEVAYGNIDLIDEKGRAFRDANFRPQDQESPGSEVLALPYSGSLLSSYADNFLCSAFLFRTATVRSTQGFLASFLGAEDYGVALELARYGHVAHLDSEVPLISYRLHSNSLTENLGSRAIRKQTLGLMRNEESFTTVRKTNSRAQLENRLESLGLLRIEEHITCEGMLCAKYLDQTLSPSSSEIRAVVQRFSSTTSNKAELVHLPAFKCPDYLRRARDSYFQAVGYSGAMAKVLVRASSHLFSGMARKNLLKYVSNSGGDWVGGGKSGVELHFLCFNKSEFESAQSFCLANKLPQNILDLSSEYEKGLFELTQALSFVFSSIDVYLTPSGITSWDDFLELRVESAVTALAALPIISLSPLDIRPKLKDCSDPSVFELSESNLSSLLDIPHLVSNSLPIENLTSVIDSLELGTYEQWLEKHSVEGANNRVHTFLASRELQLLEDPKLAKSSNA